MNRILIYKYLFFIMSFGYLQNLVCQNQMVDFTLYGKIIGIDTGSIEFIKIGFEENYHKIVIDSNKVFLRNGSFRFTGKMSYPHAFVAIIKTNKLYIPTDKIFIQTGVQFLHSHIDSLKEQTPFIENSKVNDEYIKNYKTKGVEVFSIFDDFKSYSKYLYNKFNSNIPESEKEKLNEKINLYHQRNNEFIFNYITQNSNSYIGLWQLIDRFSARGYYEIYEQAFLKLSKKLSETKSGKELWKNLVQSKVTANGKFFPIRKLLNQNNTIGTVSFKNSKYTLVDFWFSFCAPCIAEFPHFKNVYNQYKNKGFNIIGISVDNKENEFKWKDAIKKYELPWNQLWDVNGKFSNSLFIYSYPTNYLVDQNGIIIAKNIKRSTLINLLNKL